MLAPINIEYSITRRIALALFTYAILLPMISKTYASYNQSSFKSDWSSPIYNNTSKKILLFGLSTSALLILSRRELEDRLQDDWSENEPMGELAPFGDLMGRMVPNFLYMGAMGIRSAYFDDKQAAYRMTLMFKVSAYSGFTTFFLKRVFNEQRPHKGDRLSFPSGHSTTAFAFASVVALEHPNWKYEAYALASIVGLSRINDNAHYLHDVVMGASIGTAFAYALHGNQDKSAISFSPIRDGHVLKITYMY